MTQDATIAAKVQHLDGGDRLLIGSGGTLERASGSVQSVGGANVAETVTISIAASTANVSLVTITVKDGAGTAVATPHVLDVWLSDAATGIGLTGTTASGAVGAGASGTDLGVLTTKKATRVLTSAAGVYILSITDTGKTHFYVAVALGAKVTVSSQLADASYG